MPYSHVVFAIPKMLRATFRRERRLLRLYSRCAWNTLRPGLETDGAMRILSAIQNAKTVVRIHRQRVR